MEPIRIVIRNTPTAKVSIKQVHYAIPNDYEGLINLPKVNSVELKGNLSSDDLELLSSVLGNYEEQNIGEAEEAYVLVIGENGNAVIPIADFLSEIAKSDTGRQVSVSEDGDISQELTPDVFFNFTGNITSLSLSFAEPVQNRVNEYKGQFTTGASVPAVTFPEGISWVGEEFPELEPNKSYQFSVVNGIGVIVGV